MSNESVQHCARSNTTQAVEMCDSW